MAETECKCGAHPQKSRDPKSQVSKKGKKKQ